MKKLLIIAVLIFALAMVACGDSVENRLNTLDEMYEGMGVDNPFAENTPNQNAQEETTPRPEPVAGSNANFEFLTYGTVGVTITKYIGGGAEVNIPAEIDGVPVTEIGRNAFLDNVNITSVIIPNTVTIIGQSAFSGCRSLASINIPDGVTTIERSTFFACIGLISVTIPDGVTTIGNSAFYDCRSLTSITIPASVTRIDESAFNTCLSLTEVYFEGLPPRMGINVFGIPAMRTDLTIFYKSGTDGWTNPWNGFATKSY